MTDEEKLRFLVNSALKSVLIAMIGEGAPPQAIANVTTSRVMGALASRFSRRAPGWHERPALRLAEARNARNAMLLRELLAAETAHGRLACGMVAKKHAGGDPAAREALVKHLSRLRLRHRRSINSQCAAQNEQNG